jgi:hypothetical protein
VLIVTRDERIALLALAERKPPLAGSNETMAFGSMANARAWLDTQPFLDKGMPWVRYK